MEEFSENPVPKKVSKFALAALFDFQNALDFYFFSRFFVFLKFCAAAFESSNCSDIVTALIELEFSLIIGARFAPMRGAAAWVREVTPPPGHNTTVLRVRAADERPTASRGRPWTARVRQAREASGRARVEGREM